MSLVTAAANAASQIAGAISRAARATGASFEYLLTTARIESNLNPTAKAPTSSAKGLYQFIDQTWLGTIKRSGSVFGLGKYADAIVSTADGRYDVPDLEARAAIMKLRNNPAVSAMMAGAFTRSNAAELASAIGRPPSEGELYIAHFLGAHGASRLIAAAASCNSAAPLRCCSWQWRPIAPCFTTVSVTPAACARSMASSPVASRLRATQASISVCAAPSARRRWRRHRIPPA